MVGEQLTYSHAFEADIGSVQVDCRFRGVAHKEEGMGELQGGD